MGSRYKNRGVRLRLAEAASRMPHFNVIAACRKNALCREYKVGGSVRIKATGETAQITAKTHWGDYVLQGHRGKYFPPSTLEPL